MSLNLVNLSGTAAHPPKIEPHPPDGSYSERLGLQTFDLITPDGDRAWVIAGWEGGSGNIRAWTVADFLADRRPGKFALDNPRRFAPLRYVNAAAHLRESFIRDYAALNTGGPLQQEYHLGMSSPASPSGWVGRKIYPFMGREHAVRDCDTFLRLLTVDGVRANKPEHFKAVDIWEVTASWHIACASRRAKPETKSPNTDGQFLYRLYNRAGSLLYVGVTDNVFRRWKEHSRDKQWWSEVHKFTQDWYPDRRSVEAAERHAISTEFPLYNISGVSK